MTDATLSATNAAMTSDLALPGAVTPVSLDLRWELTFEDWSRVGATLGDLGRAYQWWIGDWLRFGEAKYGEKYTQAIDVCKLEYGTLANIVWVANRIEAPRRREKLTFSHHVEVAKLEEWDQDRWLDQAEENGWTRAELRRQMKEPTEPHIVLCPHCGKQLDPADLRRT